MDINTDYTTQFAGESCIVAADGTVLKRRSRLEGEGIVIADVELGDNGESDLNSTDFWIPKLSPVLENLWYEQGAVGRQYYFDVTRPYATTT